MTGYRGGTGSCCATSGDPDMESKDSEQQRRHTHTHRLAVRKEATKMDDRKTLGLPARTTITYAMMGRGAIRPYPNSKYL